MELAEIKLLEPRLFEPQVVEPVLFGAEGGGYNDCKKPLLPKEYKQVEYLQSTKTQYIDTNTLINTTRTKYVTRIKIDEVVISSTAVFGTRKTENIVSEDAAFCLIKNQKFRLDWVKGGSLLSNNLINKDTIYDIEITRGYCKLNDEIYTDTNTTSINVNYPFYIFNVNNAGNSYSRLYSGRVYYSIIYTDNIKIRHFIPCYRKADYEGGMYDLVTKTFFTNNGTGRFYFPITANEIIDWVDKLEDLTGQTAGTFSLLTAEYALLSAEQQTYVDTTLNTKNYTLAIV